MTSNFNDYKGFDYQIQVKPIVSTKQVYLELVNVFDGTFRWVNMDELTARKVHEQLGLAIEMIQKR